MSFLHESTLAPITQADYWVRGCTALLDAVGGAVKHISRVHGYLPEDCRPEHTIVVITRFLRPAIKGRNRPSMRVRKAPPRVLSRGGAANSFGASTITPTIPLPHRFPHMLHYVMQHGTFALLKGGGMEASATINVRMAEQLKQSGANVLERNGVSPTELVRSVYRYMDRHQALPECLDVAPAAEESVYSRRRELLRQLDERAVAPYAPDCKADRAARIQEKYGDLL